ncbi:MAG: hypothetical protein AAF581_19485 [Planctomycetota bacterium]
MKKHLLAFALVATLSGCVTPGMIEELKVGKVELEMKAQELARQVEAGEKSREEAEREYQEAAEEHDRKIQEAADQARKNAEELKDSAVSLAEMGGVGGVVSLIAMYVLNQYRNNTRRREFDQVIQGQSNG